MKEMQASRLLHLFLPIECVIATKFTTSMDDKLQYISKIKEERNKAQDELAELRKILELPDDISLTEHITKIKINIDKE